MSTQNEAILSKLDKVIDEQHNTNKLLTEVIADNRHRDTRIDELEAINIGLKSEMETIILWKVKNEEPIKKAIDACEKYGSTWEDAKDSKIRKKDAWGKYIVAVAGTLSVAVAGYIFGLMQDAKEAKSNAKVEQAQEK